MSEQGEDGSEEYDGSIAKDVALTAGVEGGCCLLNALTVLAMFLSVSTLLLVNR